MSPRRTQGSPPKILYFLTSTMSSRFLRGQLDFLIKHGFRVEVTAGDDTGEMEATFDPGVTFRPAPFSRNPRPRQDLKALLFAIRLVREARPDVVNASTPKAGIIGIVAAFVCRVPVRVYVVRGLRYETALGLSRRALWAIEWITCRLATHVVFNSFSLRTVAESDKLLRRGHGFVLAGGSGNGIDTQWFDHLPARLEVRAALGLPLLRPTVGFLGRLTLDKGIDDLVTAFHQIRSEGIEAHLLLAGPLEHADKLSHQTHAAIRGDDMVTWLGAVQDVRNVLAAIDVLAFPSYREGLPNAPLEAQLCGIPVVAYAATGTIDALVSPSLELATAVGDVRGLARNLTVALTDPDVRTASQLDAPKEIARRFDQVAVWTDLLQIYRSAISKLGGPAVR